MAVQRIGGEISRRPTPAPQPAAPSRPAAPPPKPKRRRAARQTLELVAIAVGALLAAASTVIGQIAVVIFGVVVIARRRGSRPVLATALFLLAAIVIFQFLGQSGISQNLAVYVFELLVIGTILALIEGRNIGEYSD